MAVPAISKTWQILPNQLTAASYGAQLVGFKHALCNFAQNPVRVIWTSNGVTAGAGDNWNSASDIVRGATTATARSMAVLQWPSGMQILIDYVDGSSNDNADFRMSPRGLFTGGSITARPTATDEIPETGAPTVLGSNPYHKQWTLGSSAKRWHAWHSTDGKHSIVLGFNQSDGSLTTFWILGEAAEVHPGWSKPHVLFIGVSGNATDQNGFTNSNDWIVAEQSQGKYQLLSTAAEAYYDGVFWEIVSFQGKNQLSNTYPTEPLYLWSGLHFSQVGRWPVDIYATTTNVTGYTTGDFVPGDGTKKFVKVNGLLLPWDGVSSFLWNS